MKKLLMTLLIMSGSIALTNLAFADNNTDSSGAGSPAVTSPDNNTDASQPQDLSNNDQLAGGDQSADNNNAIDDGNDDDADSAAATSDTDVDSTGDAN